MDICKFIELLGQQETPNCHPFGICDQYWSTWQCSHIRYVKATWDADDFSTEKTLAWIINRAQNTYITHWLENLNKVSIVTTDPTNAVNYMRSLQKEVRVSDFLTHDDTFQFPWLDTVPETLYSIKDLKLYNYGPSEIFVWRNEHSLYYFETHFES